MFPSLQMFTWVKNEIEHCVIKGIAHPKMKCLTLSAIQDVDEIASSSEQIWEI